MKPVRSIVDRDLKPDNSVEDLVEIVWTADISRDSQRRALSILREIMDTAATPGDSGKP